MAFSSKIPIVNVLAGFKPIAYTSAGLLLAKGFKIHISDLGLNKVDYIITLTDVPWYYRWLGRIRLIERLLRLELGPGQELDSDGNCIVFFKSECWKINIKKRTISKELLPNGAKKPLSILRVKAGPFRDHFIFGEYDGNNPKKDSIRIFARSPSGQWFTAYTFGAGEVNHVHGVYESEFGGFYILTGDYGNSSAVWHANEGFDKVQQVLSVGQASRACWIHEQGHLLFYVTDRQDDLNYLTEITGDGYRVLESVNGPSIRYIPCPNRRVFFSTAVEPKANKSFFKYLLSTEPAPAIKVASSFVYYGDSRIGFKEIFSAPKDCLPCAFQFGDILFPTGALNKEWILHFYCIGLKECDGLLFAVDVGHLRAEIENPRC